LPKTLYLIAARLQPFLKPTQSLASVTWADGFFPVLPAQRDQLVVCAVYWVQR
jgi:hypothetical protein